MHQRIPDRPSVSAFELWLANQIEIYERQPIHLRAPLITIPCVFHIITDGAGAENISAAQVQAQVDQLNIDFRGLAGSTNPANADIEIEFCLALLDENDNIMPEQGINRVTTYGDGPFSTNYIDNTIKPGTIWNPDDYMNVWVADIQGGILGYAQFPDASSLSGMPTNGGAATTDGVVHLYSTIGSVANPFPNGAPYNLGRTMTHEIGHWLGLRHIWGDGNCGVDDFCNDTPNSDASNFGCPTGHVSCNTTDQIENYMDYTNDACMDIFTEDQKTRMRTVMSVSPRRASLINSTKCGVPTPTIGFVSGGGTIINEGTDCGFQDVVLDLNLSSPATEDATVTFAATGAATQGLDYTILTPTIVYPAGSTPTRQVTVRIFNDGVVEPTEDIIISFNVTTIGNAVAATGDLSDHDITINDDDQTPAAGNQTIILNQDFEAGNLGTFTTQGFAGSDRFTVGDLTALTSANWTLDNSNATLFAYTNDDRCNCDKNNDRLTSPTFSLAGAYSVATLTFDHAYADINGNIAGVNVNETGQVQINTGNGWVTIANLTNNSTGTANDFYTTPWQTGVTVDLTPYIGQNNVQIRFRYRDGGEWAYGMAVDNILVTGGTTLAIQDTDNSINPKEIPVQGFETVHFYDQSTGDIMATIENLSNWNYTCTQVYVDRDAIMVGQGSAPFWNNNPANYLLSKTFYVDPANNNNAGNYRISLFFTDAELTAWENETGQSRNSIEIIKVMDNPIAVVDETNYTNYVIDVLPATVIPFGSDYILEATFTNGFSGFGAGVAGTPGVTLLNTHIVSFVGNQMDALNELKWVVNSEQYVQGYSLERSVNGIDFDVLYTQKQTNEKINLSTSFQDIAPLSSGSFYRLIVHLDNGDEIISSIVFIANNSTLIRSFEIYPNPANEQIILELELSDTHLVDIFLTDLLGRKYPYKIKAIEGMNRIPINISTLTAGLYRLHIQHDDVIQSRSFVKR